MRRANLRASLSIEFTIPSLPQRAQRAQRKKLDHEGREPNPTRGAASKANGKSMKAGIGPVPVPCPALCSLCPLWFRSLFVSFVPFVVKSPGISPMRTSDDTRPSIEAQPETACHGTSQMSDTNRYGRWRRYSPPNQPPTAHPRDRQYGTAHRRWTQPRLRPMHRLPT